MALFVKVFMLCLVLVLSCLNRAETLDRLSVIAVAKN